MKEHEVNNMRDEYLRWRERADESLQDELVEMGDDVELLRDSFYRDLAFGTGGLRGTLGAGPNRMNVHTVAKATQGLADYLNAHFDKPSVAVARDSRNKGEEFTHVVASVLAANGITSYLFPRIEPTPALSWAVRDLGCSAGICVTASHNPASYNGYKVYGSDGCQITTEAASEIQGCIDKVDMFDDAKSMLFDKALTCGWASWIGEDTLDRYIDATAACSLVDAHAEREGLKVVYTPLHGAGLECVSRILERIGVEDVVVVPEQAQPNGDFPTCPYPNPEIREALERGLALCDKTHPDLLLATDPDTDRVGIAVPHNGEYVLLNGNEVGVLLLDYVSTMLEARGEALADKVAITTIVSTAMADEIARDRGFQLRRTLTGFKFIGEQIGLLEASGQVGRFAFGFEESYGYLAGSQVRDKDAVVASMLICEMAQWHRSSGCDLVDAMDRLYQRYGYYKNGLVTIEYQGAEGAARMKAITASLRSDPPSKIAGLVVDSVVDYADGSLMPIFNPVESDKEQRLPPADVLEFQMVGGSKLLVRPSGTEPKIKAYLFACAKTSREVDGLLVSLKEAARQLLS